MTAKSKPETEPQMYLVIAFDVVRQVACVSGYGRTEQDAWAAEADPTRDTIPLTEQIPREHVKCFCLRAFWGDDMITFMRSIGIATSDAVTIAQEILSGLRQCFAIDINDKEEVRAAIKANGDRNAELVQQEIERRKTGCPTMIQPGCSRKEPRLNFSTSSCTTGWDFAADTFAYRLSTRGRLREKTISNPALNATAG